MTRRRSFELSFTLLCCGWISAAASAQVFYEPVTYQYRTGDTTFYYGGHNPRVFDMVANDVARTSYSSVVWAGRSVHVLDRLRVYSDAVPFTNLADSSYTTYGSYTAADARNEANNNAARYFRKRDLLHAAVVTDEGDIVVPAHAQPHMDVRVVRPFRGATGAAGDLPKGTILIIPRKLLEPPVKKEPPALMTSAQQ